MHAKVNIVYKSGMVFEKIDLPKNTSAKGCFQIQFFEFDHKCFNLKKSIPYHKVIADFYVTNNRYKYMSDKNRNFLMNYAIHDIIYGYFHLYFMLLFDHELENG